MTMTTCKRLHAMAFFGLLVVAGATGCKSKQTTTSGPDASASAPSANLTDLSTSLDAVRSAFNARKQQARFLTLLSPA